MLYSSLPAMANEQKDDSTRRSASKDVHRIPFISLMGEEIRRVNKKYYLQKLERAVSSLYSCGPRALNLIWPEFISRHFKQTWPLWGWCSMLMVWLVPYLSLGVAIYFAPLRLWSYALLTQMLLVTNSNIEMAITTKIYHPEWLIRS